MDRVCGGREKIQELMASSVPCKGLVHGIFSIEKCLDFIEETGIGKGGILVKTDQEASIECLVRDVVDNRKSG